MTAQAQMSIFPEGVEVHASDLAFERDTRIFEHIQRSLDEAAMGVVSGLSVTVNGADPSKVDVAAGTGYAPDGSYAVLSPGQSAIALADSTLGVVNYVCAVFTRTESDPQPHETGTNSPNTKANRSVRIRVYTAAQYAALATSDDDLANDAQDRALVLARVTATGGALTAGSIASPTAFDTINWASQPINTTGTTITGVSSNTSSGSGTLAFTFVGTLLTWTPPGGSAGAGVNVGSGGTFTVYGGGGSPPSITVEVISASLPGADKSDSIVITALYGQQVPRFTSDDWLHRSLLGTGTPTPTNPHGLRVSDLGGVEAIELETHQDIQHSNGIWRGSSAGALAVAINELTAPDELVVTAPAGADTYYVNGKRLTSILSTGISFASAPAAAVLYEILVDDTGALSTSARATWPDPRTVTGVEIIDVSDGSISGPRNLVYTNVGQTLKWDNGPTVAVGAGGHFRLISANDIDTIDVFVVAASLPGANQTDSITLGALASIDAYLRIAMVCWTGSATGYLGFTSLRGGHTARALDKRAYGNIAEYDLKDELFKHVVPNPTSTAPTTLRISAGERANNELRASGVVVGIERTEGSSGTADSLRVIDGGGLNVTIGGGVAYIFGKRYERLEQTGFTLDNNVTQWVYLDVNGVVQKSATLTLLDIIGNSSLNEPGLGVALAKVTTSGGAITALLDYRRNITRLDNIAGGLTVASGTASRNQSQFFSLQAAVEYAAALVIRSIRITGSLSEAVATTMTLSSPLRVICDPDVAVTLSGAAVKFTIASGGALEWIGGDLTITGARFISYGGNTSSWVLIRDAEITVSAGLFTNTTSVADEKGFRVEGCNVDQGAAGSDMLSLAEGWSANSQMVFRDSFFDCGTDNFYDDSPITPSETIANLHVEGCDIQCAVAFNATNGALIIDWVIRNNRFLVTSRLLAVEDSSERILIEGNEIERESTATFACIRFSGTNSYQHLNFRVLHNTFRTQAGPTSGYFSSSLAAAQKGLKIIGNNFGAVSGGSGATILVDPNGAPTTDDIEVSDNSIYSGSIDIGLSGGDTITHVVVHGNTVNGTNGNGISLDTTERFVVSDNNITYGAGDRGIIVSSTCLSGVIADNHILTTSTSSDDGIFNAAPETTISGNTIRQEGDSSASRAGINTSGQGCTVMGNSIYSGGNDTNDYGIFNNDPGVTIADNYIEFTDAAAASVAIFNSGTDVAITGNVVVADAGSTVKPLSTSGDRVSISGNKLPATAFVGDEVTASGERQAFIGNVVASGTTTGSASVGGGGATSVGSSTTNVCSVTLS